uniref:Sterile alpha motif domain-containing protein 3-like n=1 Tax=Myripristis murdjan TaxID=586833 RepID=A0A667XLB0_9TELE
MVMIIRVVVQDSDIRKITLPEKPDDTDTLIKLLGECLELKYKFTIQYEDPDFNNALCNLTDISDLPKRATLKIFPVLMSPVPIPSSSQGESVHSDQLSIQSSSTELKKEWPENFEIPRFSVHVEHRLRQGNAAFLNNGKRLDVGRDLKHDILVGLAGTMYTYKEYPSEDNFNQVAEALIKTHPCLTEPGSSTGWTRWKRSIELKMAFYRAKMRKHGCSDMALKREGESSGTSVYNRGIKKPKISELNFLEDKNEDGLESKRVEAVEEMKKKFPNLTMIAQLMTYTRVMRRQELLFSKPPVHETLERWPGLFTENQVIFVEFSQFTGKNLKQEFYTALDLHTARFLEIFRSKGGAQGEILHEFLGQTGSRVWHSFTSPL